MSNVVPFAPMTPVGDWTSGERARLAELAEQLKARGARVQVAYGVSDVGDPWCVIQDDRDEVLIHVARIGGQFVIHDAAADAVRRSDSLWGALKRLLGGGAATVVDMRKAQALLALVMAVLFVEEILREQKLPDFIHDPAPGGGHDPHPAPQDATPGPPSHLEAHLATQGSAPWSPAETNRPQATALEIDAFPQSHSAGALTGVAPGPAPGRAAAASEAPPAPGAAHAAAPPAAERAFADLPPTRAPGGAEPGHQITLAEGVVARGTSGDDAFVIAARQSPNYGLAASAQTSQSAGVILDFSAGDKLVFASGAAASIVSVAAVANVLAEDPSLAFAAKTAVTPGVRVGVDFNGDGAEDAFVMVAGPGVATLAAAPHGMSDAPADHGADPPLSLITPVPEDTALFG